MTLLAVILFFVSLCVGYLIPFLDAILFAYVISPNLDASLHIHHLIHNKQYLAAYRYIFTEAEDHIHLIHRRALFFGVLVILSLFIITSTHSLSGFGVLLGLELHMVHSLIPLLRFPDRLRMRFFWDLAESVSWKVVQYLAFATILLCIITGLAMMVVFS